MADLTEAELARVAEIIREHSGPLALQPTKMEINLSHVPLDQRAEYVQWARSVELAARIKSEGNN